MKRTPINKKLRFEILKRDNFTCQYCGKQPPDVILEIDHILPVKEGGDNSIENLITSCKECNSGKRARLLSQKLDAELTNSNKVVPEYLIKKNVKPIKNLAEIELLKECLLTYCSKRDYVLFVLGINTGLRAGDLLNLKIIDVKGKKQVKVQELKTGKFTRIYLSNIFDILSDYINDLENSAKPTIWLFPSRKGNESMTVTQAYRQLNKAAEYAHLDAIGTETMRKTFGYWYYKKTGNIGELQAIYNNFSTTATLRYIGIDDDDIEKNLKSFIL